MTDPLSTRQRVDHGALVVPAAIYLCVGVAHVYWGIVSTQVPTLRSASTLGLLVSLQFAGFLIGVLTAPGLGRLVGIRAQVAASLVLFALALIAPTWVEALPGLVAAGGVFGFAAGTLETQVAALALQSVNGAHALTLLETFFGLGAVIFPLYLVLLSELVAWPILVGAVAVGVLALSAAWLVTTRSAAGMFDPTPADLQPATPKTGAPRRVPSPTATVMLFFAFLYAGFETNFANFLPAILGSEGASTYSLLAVSAFWGGITIGRLVATWRADAIARLRTLAGLAALLGAVLILCAVIADDTGVALLLAVLLAGLLAAGLFPGALTLCAREAGLPTPRTTSYFVASASLGGSLMALPVGWSLDSGGARAALGLLAGVALSLVLLTAAAGVSRSRSGCRNH